MEKRGSIMKKIFFSLLLCLAALLCFVACGGEENSEETLTLTYMNDGAVFETVTYREGDKVKEPKTAPEKDGYVFNGWYYDKGTWEQPLDITTLNSAFYSGSYTLHARYETVRFSLNEDKISYTVLGTVLPDFAGELTIPSEYLGKKVTHIENGAFRNMDGITAVTLPETLVTVGQYAFAECDGLVSVRLPNSVKNLERGAFYICRNLREVLLSAAMTEITGSCFEGCVSLTDVSVPYYVATIGGAAFKGCTALKNVTFPNGLDKISDSAFENCTALTSLAIPARMTTIGNESFKNCTSLTSLVFVANSRLSSVGSRFLEGSAVQVLELPESVTVLAENAFACEALQTLTFGGSLVSVGASVFAGVSSSAAVTYRGTADAFYGIVLLAQTWSDGRTAVIVCTDGEIAAMAE